MKVVSSCQGSPSLLIACLCASWCTSCQGWQREFETIAQHLPNPIALWIDIDDDEHLLPELLDVVQMPMILIAEADSTVVFFGPVEPRIGTLISLAVSHAFPDALLPEGDGVIASELLARLRTELSRMAISTTP